MWSPSWGPAANPARSSPSRTACGMRVLVAPTTKMMLGEADEIGPLVTSEDAGELRERAEKALSESPTVVAGSGMLSKNRVGGVDPGWIGDLSRLVDVVL